MLSSIDRIELGNDTDTRELHLKKAGASNWSHWRWDWNC